MSYKFKSIAVFCGANSGLDSKWAEYAYKFGKLLAQKNLEVVFGGGKVGIMGAIANGCLTAGGKVVGVIPEFLTTKEIMHDKTTEMIVVDNMHQRKAIMHDRAEAFIMLPGGYGTLEEVFEILTWAQLGLHKKPIGILNQDGFYNSLLSLIQDMVDQGFLKVVNRDMLLVSENAEHLLELMNQYEAPNVPKWISEGET